MLSKFFDEMLECFLVKALCLTRLTNPHETTYAVVFTYHRGSYEHLNETLSLRLLETNCCGGTRAKKYRHKYLENIFSSIYISIIMLSAN